MLGAANLTGQRFGKLVAIRPTDMRDGCKSVVWECKCDCGGTKFISAVELRRGRTQSCGCTNREDLTGQRFGKLVVLKFEGTFNSNPHWRCKCDCGREHVVDARALKSGHTQSCGCVRTVDIAGQRFGKLTAIRPTGEKDARSNTLWLCKCDCGNERVATVAELRIGRVWHCGCSLREDLVGKRFGRLVVLSSAGNNPETGRTQWNCICDCGRECVVSAHELKSGRTKSCGCLKVEIDAQRLKTHGESNTRIYRIWAAMRQRCQNPNNNIYSYYGGLGISVCTEWEDYEVFRDWALGAGYDDSLSIDRINPFRDYTPQNCTWSTNRTQAENKRNPYTILMSKLTSEALESEIEKFTKPVDIYNLVVEYLNITLSDVTVKLFRSIPYEILGADSCQDLRGYGSVESLLTDIMARFSMLYCDYVRRCILVYQGESSSIVSEVRWISMKDFDVTIDFTLDDFHKVMQEHFMQEEPYD